MSKYLLGDLDEQLIDEVLSKMSEHDHRYIEDELLDAFIYIHRST